MNVRLPPPPQAPSAPLPPPPPTVPGRRDRRRRPLIAGVVLLVAAVVLSSLFAYGGLPSTRAARGPHSFLESVNGSPYRWNPCQPIHYVVNRDHEPSGADGDIREAIRRVSDATGVTFIDDGTTNETADQQIGSAFQTTIPGVSRYLPLLITFVTRQHFGYLADTNRALAFGMPYRGDGQLAHTYVSGVVVIDADDPLPLGFGQRFALGPVLMHELAHVMGLGHVGASDEIMWSPQVRGHDPFPDPTQTDWGPGDLEGLRDVGRSAGCLPQR